MSVDIEKLRRLLATATPGEWAVNRYCEVVSCDDLIATPTDNGRKRPRDREDMTPICAAVNALPELLRIAEAAYAYVDKLLPSDFAGPYNARQNLIAAVDAARKEGA